MRTYLITSSAGAELGRYNADTPAGALEAMARDAGYATYAAACAVAGPFEGTVRELEEPEDMLSAAKLYEALLAIEADGSEAPDKRRIMRDERNDLHAAMQSGDAARIDRRVAEGNRVLRLWRTR